MIRIALLACLWLCVAPVQASDLQPLLDSGELRVDSSIEPSDGLVPGQRGRLVLSVATGTWFTGGTRIRIPEVPGLVILQTEQFAANTSETRNGRTWVVQRWTLDLYPQREGDFTIPAITLSVQVNAGDRGNLSGDIESPPLAFRVSLPAALAQADRWVAAPAFSVTQRVDRDLDSLQPGDAFERRIEFRGEDVLAMMLPVFEEDPLPGLAAYAAPPQLDNRSNRGRAIASRTRVISYVAEQPGRYVLPAQDFFWWNTRAQALEVLSLEALTVEVAGEAPVEIADASRLSPRQLLTLAGAVLGLGLAGWLLWRYRPWRVLRVLADPLRRLQAFWIKLRRPALPDRLNP
jgi:hypothetical protein